VRQPEIAVLNLVREVANQRSIKRCRKRPAWDRNTLPEILGPRRRRPVEFNSLPAVLGALHFRRKLGYVAA
jgi:hypothetical protein